MVTTTATPVSPMASGKCWLDRRHPDYAEMAPHWKFIAESYDGGPGWFHKGNLPKYASEHPEKYKNRVASATRDNYTAEVVDRHTGYLFQRKPNRSGGPKLTAFWDNARIGKGNMDDLMALVATESAKFQWCVVIVDKPAVAATSAMDDRLPYCYIVTPLDVLDWSTDEDGGLLELLTMERTRRPGSLTDPDSGVVVEQYRLRTRDGWSLWEKQDGDAVLVAEGRWFIEEGRPLGVVPAVFAHHKDGHGGLVDEIARIDRVIAQEESSQHEVVTWLGCPTLTYPGDVEDPITFGAAGLITYDPNSPNAPTLLAIDGGSLSAIDSRIGGLVEKIRMLGSLPSMTAGRAAQTAESKAWDAQELATRLGAKAQNMQAAEIEIAAIADRMMGGDGSLEGASILYPTSFDVASLSQDAIDELTLDETVGAYSPTYRVRRKQRLARKSLPDEDADVLATIDAEIEANITAGDTAPDDRDEAVDGTDDGQEDEAA